MLLNILNKIPLIKCLTYFPARVHKQAIMKFTALWVLTSLPVILATAISPIPGGDLSIHSKFLSKLREAISISELFVYSATFLTPVLYMIIEKYQDSNEDGFGDKISKSISSLFDGYGLIAFISILTMLLTAVAFALIKVNHAGFNETFIAHYLPSLSLPIYIFSLYCWYLTLLDGKLSGDYVEETRAAEQRNVEDFSKRLRTRGK